jgi:4-aminobutyrate aminotransferase
MGMTVKFDPIEHISPVWTRYTPIIAQRGSGSYIYDQNGERYLDFSCGIGVTSTGHCHPRIVEAIREQAGKLIHGQVNILLHQPLLELVAELNSILHPSLDGYFFSNSGAEAVEGAIKLARHVTKRTNIIVFQGSFHGRTIGTMSLTTSKTIYRIGYQPLMPGVFVAPYPYSYRYGWSDEETTKFCLNELEYLLITQTAPSETASILIEPILGEGGYVVPPKNFLRGVRDICDQHGILLIADEVQSGFGRSGKWFAHEHFDLVPDIMTVAKGIASGLPLSGVISRMELMEQWMPGSHGGTYGGNAVSMAAAVATIQTIKDENLLDNAVERGKRLLSELKDLKEDFPVIGDVRGLGLMIGTEIRAKDGSPDKQKAKKLVHQCQEGGLLLLTCGPWDNTIRWIPPLIVNEEQIMEGVMIFKNALQNSD